jgi:energy-coupling factor transporter ATP-binding protein EcfA2
MSVVWLNGPLGAGKTTLAHALRALVHPVAAVAVLDEDDVREAIADATMSWTVESAIPIAQLSGLARVLAQQGLVVVVAASDVDPSLLAWNREHLPAYREVYLRASPETIKHHARRRRADGNVNLGRDDMSKAVAAFPNAAALAPSGPSASPGRIARPAPVSPRDPDLTLDMDNPEPPELLAFRVAVLIPEFVVAAVGAAGQGQNRLRRGA